MNGHVYIIRSDEGPVKIGISIHPEKRIRSIGLASGRSIVQAFVSPEIPNPQQIEVLLFERFAAKRMVGEWFSIDFDEAVNEANNIGLKNAGEEWVDKDRYLRGKTALDRRNAFYDKGRTQAEIEAFEFGFSLCAADADYAGWCDVMVSAIAIQTLHDQTMVAIDIHSQSWLKRRFREILLEQNPCFFEPLSIGSDSTI